MTLFPKVLLYVACYRAGSRYRLSYTVQHVPAPFLGYSRPTRVIIELSTSTTIAHLESKYFTRHRIHHIFRVTLINFRR